MTTRQSISRISSIRNFGIIAHVDAGKTTLTERVLHLAGLIHEVGEVHDGNTVTDFDPREQQHGITISAAAVSCAWQGCQLQLIDTPGHIDFTLEVERSLRVLDGAVVVLDGVRGVESQTETVWKQADRHRVPRIVLVNKLDRPGADFERVVDQIERQFGVTAAVVGLAYRHPRTGELVGVVDLVQPLDGLDLPEDVRREASLWREQLLEVAADIDDDVAEAFLDHHDVEPQLLLRGLRRATLRGRIVPVLGGSAYRHIGVGELLDAVVRFLPSPTDRPPVADTRSGDLRPASEDVPVSALCFSVKRTDHGYLSFVRVYSGVLRQGQRVTSAETGKAVRVGRLVHVFADHQQPVKELAAGQIGAVIGPRLTMGDTLSDTEHPVCFESLVVPEPVVRMALEPASRVDQDRLGSVLDDLRLRDPSLRVEIDGETGQIVLAGLGELHLAIAIERLREEHGVTVVAKAPRVSYREALTQMVHIEHTLSKQTGGPGMFARLFLDIGPADEGSGLVFNDARRGDDVPTRYVEAVKRGLLAGMEVGPLAGFPILDAEVTLLGGAAHPNDSSDLAFQTAAQRAFREAALDAAPALLEPVVRVEVRVDAAHIGDVAGDLGARRGQLVGIDHGSDGCVIHARCPLAEMFGYARALRSLTHGGGSFSMAVDAYAAVPAKLQREVLATLT